MINMIQIGRVYGEVIGSKFTFATREYYKKVHVQISDSDNRVLVGKITEKRIVNKLLSSPNVIKYIDDTMDLQRDTIYIYEVAIIGTIENNMICADNIPALPGTAVFESDDETIALAYGIHTTEIKVGYLRNSSSCKVFLDIDRIFNPHMTVIGKTGSGKSYFIKGLLKQMTKQIFYVFSPSDEYNEIVKKGDAQLFDDIPLPLDVDNLAHFLSLNMTEETILQKINFEVDRIYSVKEITAAIIMYYKAMNHKQGGQMRLNFLEQTEQEIQLPQYALTLMQKLKNVKNLKFTRRPSETVQLNKSVVFDMSEYSQIEQECILDYYLYRIYQKCKRVKNGLGKKHIIFIEEAHNFVPSVKSTLCKDIIVKLAREGRKYGIGLCFITQRPRNFDQTSLSQSSNKFVFSVPNPDDAKYVLDDAVYFKPDLGPMIQSQRQGQCIVIGDAFRSELELQVKFD